MIDVDGVLAVFWETSRAAFKRHDPTLDAENKAGNCNVQKRLIVGPDSHSQSDHPEVSPLSNPSLKMSPPSTSWPQISYSPSTRGNGKLSKWSPHQTVK